MLLSFFIKRKIEPYFTSLLHKNHALLCSNCSKTCSPKLFASENMFCFCKNLSLVVKGCNRTWTFHAIM